MAFYNRVVYRLEAKKLIGGLNPSDKTCAEISGSMGRGFDFKSFEEPIFLTMTFAKARSATTRASCASSMS